MNGREKHRAGSVLVRPDKGAAESRYGADGIFGRRDLPLLTREPGLKVLVPLAGVTWTVAALSVHVWPSITLVAIGVSVLTTGCFLVMARRPGHRHQMRHVQLLHVLVTVAVILQAPALLRHENDSEVWAESERSGALITTSIRIHSDPEITSHKSEWNRGTVQAVGTVPRGAEIRVGRGTYIAQSETTVLLQWASTEEKHTPDLSGHASGHRTLIATGTVSRSGTLVILRAGEVRTAASRTTWRDEFRSAARLATAHLPDDAAGLTRGMTTGDTSRLSPEVEDSMRISGISHLVAVSGANIAMVLGAVLIPLLALGVRRQLRILAACGVGALYVAVIGAEPSVLRASTMAVPLLLARYLGHPLSTRCSVMATIALWSVVDPLTASGVGFTLSAVATAAIVFLAPTIAEVLHDWCGERIRREMLLVLAVPLAVQTAVTPILVLMTPEISIWAVAVNIVVSPFVLPVTILGLCATVIAPLTLELASTLFTVAGGGASVIIAIADVAASAPGARIAVPEGPPGAILCAVAGAALILVWWFRHTRWMKIVIVGGTAMVVLIAMLPRSLLSSGTEWRIAACDVGQGDAIVLRADSDGPTMLIDTGPEPARLRSCLHGLGVHSIDVLVLTHPHADHTGGRTALTGRWKPDEQWLCPHPESSTHALYGTPQRTARTGDTVVDTEGLRVSVLWPDSEEAVKRSAVQETSDLDSALANNCSVTLHAVWSDGLSLISLGDLEPAAQREVAQDVSPAQIVKVAHHGSSRQSPELYERIGAREAIIQSGADNTFGHPARQTLEFLARHGTRIHRNDTVGHVLMDDQRSRPLGAGADRVSVEEIPSATQRRGRAQ